MPDKTLSSKTVYLTGNETLILDGSLMPPKTAMAFNVVNCENQKRYAIFKTSNGKYKMEGTIC